MHTPREVSESYWEAECARDLDGVVSHYHADGVHESPGIVARGHDEILRMFGESMTEYPGLEVTIVEKPADSTAISLGFPLDVTRRDDDFYALAVANSYLGEHRTFNGKLMQDLRGKRGLNHVHVGSLHAADPQMALRHARACKRGVHRS